MKTDAQFYEAPKVWNSLTAAGRPKKYQKFTLPSMTVPNQSMSIRTLIERYAKGLPIEGQFEAIYEELGLESDGINPKSLDLVDFQRMRLENNARIMELEAKQKEEDRQRASDKKKAENALREAENDQKLLAEAKQKKQNPTKEGTNLS